MADPSTTPRPSHLGICVAELDRSLRFYCDGLGFEPAEGFELDSADLPGLDRGLEVDGPVRVTSQMIVNGPMRVELLHYPDRPPRGVPSTSRGFLGLTHLSFVVADVDETADRLVAHGGSILEPTRVDIGIPIVFLTDPDGTRIELMGAI